MRIAAGEFGGRALATPRSNTIRPTSDRLRQAIFNILTHAYCGVLENARVIDLFAGTGALGLEALSRGACFATFVDNSAEGRGLIRANIDALGLGGRTRLFRRDATALGALGVNEPCSLAFLDPPYNEGLAERCLQSLTEGGWLCPNALAIVEESAIAEVGVPEGFETLDQRCYGDTQIHLLRWRA